jgi:hypothetical protein
LPKQKIKRFTFGSLATMMKVIRSQFFAKSAVLQRTSKNTQVVHEWPDTYNVPAQAKLKQLDEAIVKRTKLSNGKSDKGITNFQT